MENSESFNIIVYILSAILSAIIIYVFFKMATTLKNINTNLNVVKELLLEQSKEKDSEVKNDIEIVSKEDAKSITVKNKENSKVETISMEYWGQMKKMYGEDKYEIIKYHK